MKSHLMRFAGFALLATLLTGCDSRKLEPGVTTPTTNAAAAPAPSPYQKLLGRWERPDGGYVLELTGVDAQGRFSASYFNPSAIHVEQARGALESAGLKLFVVLRDVNYPGCLYRLTYDAKSDQLFGTYHQPAMNATYDVTFGRLGAGAPQSSP